MPLLGFTVFKEKGLQWKMTDCIDCPDVKVHGTGSTLWVSCPHVSGWRLINSKCVLKTLRKEKQNNEKTNRNC